VLQQLGKNAQRTKNILVVDDEQDINLTLECILEQGGFKVDSFTNPLTALQNVKPGLYDIIINNVLTSLRLLSILEFCSTLPSLFIATICR
jgi:DNA-binding response OmpR family regulator